MRRRGEAGGLPVKGRRRSTTARAAGKASATPLSTADLQEQLDRRTRERDEALEQQAATADVLKVINRSTFELQLVLETLIENATKLGGAEQGFIYRFDGEFLRMVADCGAYPEFRSFRQQNPPRPGDGSIVGWAALERRTVHIPDIVTDPQYKLTTVQKLGGYRALLSVPMLREDILVGVIHMWRTEARPFTEKQIELVETFADQAVIAIENTRLLSELRESLQQQTATADALKVIASSTGELQPVFQAMLENAVRICEANFGVMYRYDDGLLNVAATLGTPPALADFYRKRGSFLPKGGVPLERLLHTKKVVHTIDVAAEHNQPPSVALGGARSHISVPMLKDDQLIGAIVIYRREVRPFTNKQIELVKNFAAQAVIAIENTRLLNELHQRTDDLTESLEQQTATSEVLKVIASSTGELQPVFSAMLANAARLCEASYGALWLCKGDDWNAAAMHGDLPPAYLDWWRSGSWFNPGPNAPMPRAAAARGPVHIPDMREDISYLEGGALPVSAVEVAGVRTLLCVPMMRENEIIGAIAIYRQEVRPFTDKQIELVQNFAAQAVIAIENTRLLNELRQRTDDLSEALDQQTATAEMLQVINSSPGNLAPVFDAMVESAMRFCHADYGHVFSYDGNLFHLVAAHGEPQYLDWIRQGGPRAAETSLTLERIVAGETLVHIADIAKDAGYRAGNQRARTIIDHFGIHTLLTVALRKEGALLGTFVLYRQQAKPFSDKQIALVKNFAAQAVIAIENARLLGELRDSLEQQTATTEVLSVISSSPGELEPVFQSMLENAMRICEAKFGMLFMYQGGAFRAVTWVGVPPAYEVNLRQRGSFQPDAGAPLDRLLQTKQLVHSADESPNQTSPAARYGGARSLVAVPMLKENELIGAIGIYRQEVRPFTDKQIALVTNFAAQAVIAIENTRLLNELRERTDDLSESLEQQTATSEILAVISNSLTDTQPAFDTIVESGLKLFPDATITVVLTDAGMITAAAIAAPDPVRVEAWRRTFPYPLTRDYMHGRAILDRKLVDFADVAAAPADLAVGAKNFLTSGHRAITIMPMIRGEEAIGAISVVRLAPGPLSDKQLAVLQTFANQAVIAIENTRLLNELRESLEQQKASGEILASISGSMTDTKPVFDAIVRNLLRLFGTRFAVVQVLRDGVIDMPAVDGEAGFEKMIDYYPRRLDDTTFGGQAILSKQVVQLAPVQGNPAAPPTALQFSVEFGFNSVIFAPMIRDNRVIGAIGVARHEPAPFSEKQVALIKAFADQAVIAIENTRLFNELRERTDDLTLALEYQTATSEVLNVISRSPNELQPVLDAILQTAGRLCEAEYACFFKLQDGKYHVAASNNAEDAYIKYLSEHPISPGRSSLVGRTGLERRTVHMPDCLADPEYEMHEYQRVGKHRSMLGVPLLRDGVAIAVIGLLRTVVKPFTEKQIDLVTTFADQAMIAIENVRLFEAEQERTAELTESLEQQTATSEVLRVISSSPGKLDPVFQTVLENAVQICEARFGMLALFDGSHMRQAAAYNVPPAFEELRRREPVISSDRSVAGRVLETKAVVRFDDLAAEQRHASSALVKMGGARTVVGVPMLKEDELIGAIVIYRTEVRPFTDKQVKLLTDFAAQAVIAIENTRLLNELRESLQQQTATADVLKVISRSTFDLQIVLDTLTESAAQLCEAELTGIVRPKDTAYHWATTFGFPPDFSDHITKLPISPGRGSVVGRALLDGRFAHIPDVLADPEYTFLDTQKLGGYRSVLAVPLLREGNPIGVIFLSRKSPRPFTEKQIELASTFADQAVIAIENVRLFEEVQARTEDLAESLQQQTATADVLKVISRSTFDLQTVLDALVESAVRLCEADTAAINRPDGKFYQQVATCGFSETYTNYRKDHPIPLGPSTLMGRTVAEGHPVQIADALSDPNYGDQEARKLGGFRAMLGIPLMREGIPIGVLVVTRTVAREFTAKQIDLLTIFADQAVIAIENVRLFDEVRARTEDLQESLQQQTATAEVLSVMSRSKFDLAPVLQSVVDTAVRLCRADQATISRLDGGAYRFAAGYSLTPRYLELERAMLIAPGPGTVVGRAAMQKGVVRIDDAMIDPLYEKKEDAAVAGTHTMIGVPLMRDGEPIGVIALARRRVEPFSDKEVELVTTFADQAVIAIENVRLFEEVQARTAELSRSLEDLRTTQDRLVQTEKLASLGQLTAGIAHEIKNPLNFVNNFSAVSAELIDELQEALKGMQFDGKTRAEVDEIIDMLHGNLHKVVQHGKRADSIVKNMLLHSREGSGEHRPVDINAVVEESLNLAYHGARAEKQGFNITLERSLDPAAGEVDLFPQEITRVLLNLISNGFYAATRRKGLASKDGYEPTLSAATKDLGDSVEIRIRDNGTGIPPEVKERMFNPFFTTKPVGEGTGLGLSISHDIIVKQHAGSIEVDTKPGEFTEFKIVLPRSAASLGKSGAQT